MKLSNAYEFSAITCPKCQGHFIATPKMQPIGNEFFLVYECDDCKSLFAARPVTTVYLCELTTN